MNWKRWLLVFFSVAVVIGLVGYVASCGHSIHQGGSGIRVVSVFPEDKSTGISSAVIVSAIFDLDLDPASLSTTSFTLSSTEGNVPGAVTYEASSRIATFTPAMNLVLSTAYTATLSGGITSVSGLGLDAAYSWSFTTGSLEDTAVGTLDAVLLNEGNAFANMMMTDTLNRIFVVGQGSQVTAGLGGISGKSGMILLRLQTDGTKDSSFGTAGAVIYNGAAGSTSYEADIGLAMALDPEGKILVTGYGCDTSNEANMVVWRLNSDGKLDGGFDADGIAVFKGGDYHVDHGNFIAVAPSGKIIVVGISYSYSGFAFQNNTITIWNYNSDGTLDQYRSYTPEAGSVINAGSARMDPSGKILVGGAAKNGSAALWRFNADGSLDTGFGSSGQAVDVRAGMGKAVMLDTAGNIFMTGSALNAVAIWKFDPSGLLDNSFGDFGRGICPGSNNYEGKALALDPLNKILVVGNNISEPSSFSSPLALWRFSSDGIIDNEFGENGRVQYDSGVDGDWDQGNSVRTDFLGRILVGGTITNSGMFLSSNNAIVLRFK